MAKIYLSSTYEDLKGYRRVVYEALRKAGHQVIAMEDYVATDQRPVKKCIKDVEAADIYVGLFAFRYGYRPPREHNNPNGRSITELEYRCAAASKKSCLMFVVNDTTAWPRVFDDAHTGDDRGERIKALRQHLLTEKLASQFSAPHELSTLVLAAVAKHLAEHEQQKPVKGQRSSNADAITWDIRKDRSPYPGLMHFTGKYAKVFFGRDVEVREILDRLREPESRFLLISGASGSGKSSLVDAGVLPRIEKDGVGGDKRYTCVRMVPSQGQHPFDALMRSLHGYAEQAGMVAYTEGEQLLKHPAYLSRCLQKIISKCLKTAELVLFLDQMEELFTVCDRAQANDFLAALHHAVHEAQFRVIATIRSDFLHHCHEQADLLRILNGRGHIGLGPIDASSIRDMIFKPAEYSGLAISQQLVQRIVREAGSEPGSLPLLAFALRQLFDKRKGKELTEAAYNGMAGLVGAVGTQVDQVMKTISDEARASFDRVLAELVHLERDQPPTRRPVPLAVFDSDAHAMQLIRKLAGPDCRILIMDEHAQKPTVEVAHEKLFTAWPRLKAWIEDSGEALRLIDYAEEAAARWHETGCHFHELWRRERADEIRRDLKRFTKTPALWLQSFLEPQSVLTEKLTDTSLSHQDRLLIGQKLAEFGDTRPGVGVKDGLPDIVWIGIPGGLVKLENIDHLFKVNPFRLAKYPVTNEQFEAFLKAEDGYRNGEWWKDIEQIGEAADPSWQESNCPRETVSWYEAIAFCRWLTAKIETRIRLPTEWEWRQAATGGDPQGQYPWEGGWDSSRCNSYESRLNRTTAVGIYPCGATQQGVHDMLGNVGEWCLNGYERPERPEAVRIDKKIQQRVILGGSWFNRPDHLRASIRIVNFADSKNHKLGFRLAHDLEP